MRPLVIVRPQPGAAATADAARALGMETVVMPLFAIEPVAWTAPDRQEFDGLLLTSANAVRQAGEQLDRLRPLPAYCVGEATGSAAARNGLDVTASGHSGVDALLRSIAGGLRLLHLCGEHRRQPEFATQQITAMPVYRSVELQRPEGFAQVESATVAIHSSRAASVFAKHVDAARIGRGGIAIAAISADAAAAAGDGWLSLERAAEPSDSALLAIALRLCNISG